MILTIRGHLFKCYRGLWDPFVETRIVSELYIDFIVKHHVNHFRCQSPSTLSMIQPPILTPIHTCISTSPVRMVDLCHLFHRLYVVGLVISNGLEQSQCLVTVPPGQGKVCIRYCYPGIMVVHELPSEYCMYVMTYMYKGGVYMTGCGTISTSTYH